MIPAWDYSQTLRDVKRAFEWRYEKNGFGGVRMVGLLFAPPEARLARDEIIPALEYFHHRSGTSLLRADISICRGCADARPDMGLQRQTRFADRRVRFETCGALAAAKKSRRRLQTGRALCHPRYQHLRLNTIERSERPKDRRITKG